METIEQKTTFEFDLTNHELNTLIVPLMHDCIKISRASINSMYTATQASLHNEFLHFDCKLFKSNYLRLLSSLERLNNIIVECNNFNL